MRTSRIFYFLYLAVTLCALAFLVFSAGVALAYYRLFPYPVYEKAFQAGKAYYQETVVLPAKQEADLKRPVPPGWPSGVTVWKKGAAYNGFTLLNSPLKTHAQLIDMEGRTVHEWSLPRDKIPFPDTHKSCTGRLEWSAVRAFENGDLIAMYSCMPGNSGHDLIRINKDSKLIWRAPISAHHDFKPLPDGRIVTLTAETITQKVEGIKLPPPFFDNLITVLGPNGEVQENVSLLEALRDSPYRHFLDESRPRASGDYMHTNSVHMLTPDLAHAFPQFNVGQVLVSMRNLHLIGVVDLQTRKMVWATRGAWRMQHYAHFMPDGTIQLFDNHRIPKVRTFSRVVKYNLSSQSLVWQFKGNVRNKLYSNIRGMQQSLPNGNVLITQGVGGRLLEVTPGGKIVWQYYYPYRSLPVDNNSVTTGLRYGPDFFPFRSSN